MGTRFASGQQVAPEDAAKEAEEPTHARAGLHGDLPTRLALWLIRIIPPAIEPIFSWPATAVIVALAGPQRRAVARNLRHIPDRQGAAAFLILDVYRVFLAFGQSYVEGLRARRGQLELEWEVEGEEHLEEIRNGNTGCLLLTGHTANYDIAATLFAERFGRILNIVRAPERTAELDDIRREQLQEIAESSPLLRIHYNTNDMTLGVELARALERGEVVAVQADRAAGKVSATNEEIPGGHLLRLPRGPLMLAAIAETRAFPLFVIRAGPGRYRVLVFDALVPQGKGGITEPWIDCLLAFLREHWMQWFMFEDAFEDPGEENATADA